MDNDGIDVDVAVDNSDHNSADGGSAVANDNGSVAVDNSDNSTNDSFNTNTEINTEINTTFELTIGDVQLNATDLSASVSSVTIGGDIPPSGAVTGDISGSTLSDNQGLFITNNNTGVASINNSQNVNVGTVNN